MKKMSEDIIIKKILMEEYTSTFVAEYDESTLFLLAYFYTLELTHLKLKDI